MKSSIFIGLTACWLASTSLAATELAVIPQPQNIERREGSFRLTPDLVIVTDAVSKDTGKFLAERLRPATGYSIKTKVRKGSDQTFSGSVIILTTENASTNLGAEGYELSVTPGGVTISAPTQAGLFYGAQGNIWTEFIPNQQIAEYMTFPRQLALAEVVWSPKESRDYEGFLCRLKINEQRLDQLGVNYRNCALGDGTDSQNETK